jgi:hypothetical protein
MEVKPLLMQGSVWADTTKLAPWVVYPGAEEATVYGGKLYAARMVDPPQGAPWINL